MPLGDAGGLGDALPEVGASVAGLRMLAMLLTFARGRGTEDGRGGGGDFDWLSFVGEFGRDFTGDGALEEGLLKSVRGSIFANVSDAVGRGMRRGWGCYLALLEDICHGLWRCGTRARWASDASRTGSDREQRSDCFRALRTACDPGLTLRHGSIFGSSSAGVRRENGDNHRVRRHGPFYAHRPAAPFLTPTAMRPRPSSSSAASVRVVRWQHKWRMVREARCSAGGIVFPCRARLRVFCNSLGIST